MRPLASTPSNICKERVFSQVATFLPSLPVFQGVLPLFAHSLRIPWENEFLKDDVNKFSWLARSTTPVGSLIQATQSELEQSPRYQEILAPLALGDELRAALITSGVCWGFLCLHRDRSSPHFTPAEVAFIGRLTPHMAEGLRMALLLGGATGERVPDEPGLLLLAA